MERIEARLSLRLSSRIASGTISMGPVNDVVLNADSKSSMVDLLMRRQERLPSTGDQG